MTAREKAELRTVAAVMRSCAASLPAASVVGQKLVVGATKLSSAVDGNRLSHGLSLVRGGE